MVCGVCSFNNRPEATYCASCGASLKALSPLGDVQPKLAGKSYVKA